MSLLLVASLSFFSFSWFLFAFSCSAADPLTISFCSSSRSYSTVNTFYLDRFIAYCHCLWSIARSGGPGDGQGRVKGGSGSEHIDTFTLFYYKFALAFRRSFCENHIFPSRKIAPWTRMSRAGCFVVCNNVSFSSSLDTDESCRGGWW